MYGIQMNHLANAQMDLNMASQAALQAFTLLTVGYSAEVYIQQLNQCLEHAAAALGKKVIDAEPMGEA